jgi:hypothetical protein
VNNGLFYEADTQFGIHIYNYDDEATNAQSKINDLLQIYRDLPYNREFELIERSSVSIAGIEGELAIYNIE